MRRILLSGWLLCASFANAATLSPVQLLNPAGSTAGQAIVSTGPASAPAWGGVTVGGIAAIAANTVLANATGSSAAPTAFAMPSCGTADRALRWLSGTGFTCNSAINASQLGGATFAAPGPIGSTTPSTGAFTTLSATGAITPSQTAGIVGTTTNNDANAGSFGEYRANSTVGASLTSAAAGNATSIANLPAGDWDVSCVVTFVPAVGTTPSILAAGVNTASATIPGSNTGGYVQLASTFAAGAAQVMISPTVRVSTSSATTTYCVAQSTFTGGTMTANGFIRARKPR